MSTKPILFIAILTIALLLGSLVASAHVLDIDGPVGAVMHIDPNDNPAARATAQLFFQFKNTDGAFDLRKCDCVVSISEANSSKKPDDFPILSSTPGMRFTMSTVTFPYVFPDKAVYNISVDGSSTPPGMFPVFHLRYTIRVDTEGAAVSGPTGLRALLAEHAAHIFIFGGGIIIGLIITLYEKHRGRI